MSKSYKKCLHCKSKTKKLNKLQRWANDFNSEETIYVCEDCIWEMY